MLIIGGMFSSSTGKGRVILVGLYVSHFSCQYVEIPGATTFHVALPSRLQCKCLFFVISTRHPARGIYRLTTELQTRCASRRIFASMQLFTIAGMQKMENTMITAPARVLCLPSTNRASRTRLIVRLFGLATRHQIDPSLVTKSTHDCHAAQPGATQPLRHDPRLKTTWHRFPHLDPLCPRGRWRLGREGRFAV